MMKNKNGILAAIVLSAGIVAPAVQANTVVLTQGSYSYGDGGEFTATTTPTQALGAYSSYTSTSTSFQTFCVQVTTEFAPGVSYDYTVSLNSVGGPGYPGGTATLGNPNSYALSEGTAWLYSQFAMGTLAGYDFSNDLGQRWSDAGLLQAAIWALQGGQAEPGFVSGTVDNVFYNDVVTALGANIDTAATTSDNYGVEIMNLSSGGAENSYQNQLVMLPTSNTIHVPDSATTLFLLTMGLAGLGVYSRKLATIQQGK